MSGTTIQSITGEMGSSADANTIRSEHVNRWTWVGMGARSRTVVVMADGLMVDIYLGAGIRKRRLVIKVNALDLYDIEIGWFDQSKFEWIVEAQCQDIYCDELDESIRDLYDANKV
jgi:hypothetical protein